MNQPTQILRVLLLALLAVGCGQSVQRKELPSKNPTSYTFEGSPATIHEAIIKAFGGTENYLTTKLTLEVKSEEHPFSDQFLDKVLEKLGNEYDGYLHSFHTPICKSDVYYRGGQPLDYIAAFHLHLTRVDEKRTQVDVFTHQSEVIAGKNWTPLSPHGTHANNYEKVEPTTIEEYSILLRLGDVLEVKEMPPIKLPLGAKDWAAKPPRGMTIDRK